MVKDLGFCLILIHINVKYRCQVEFYLFFYFHLMFIILLYGDNKKGSLKVATFKKRSVIAPFLCFFIV